MFFFGGGGGLTQSSSFFPPLILFFPSFSAFTYNAWTDGSWDPQRHREQEGHSVLSLLFEEEEENIKSRSPECTWV